MVRCLGRWHPAATWSTSTSRGGPASGAWTAREDARTKLTTGIPRRASTRARTRRSPINVSGDQIMPTINKTVQPVAADATVRPGASRRQRRVRRRRRAGRRRGPAARHLGQPRQSPTPAGQSSRRARSSTGEDVAGVRWTHRRIDDAVAAAARPVGSTDAGDLVELTPEPRGPAPGQVPEGRWQVDTYGKATLTDDTSGYHRGYLDLLDPSATRLALRLRAG